MHIFIILSNETYQTKCPSFFAKIRYDLFVCVAVISDFYRITYETRSVIGQQYQPMRFPAGKQYKHMLKINFTFGIKCLHSSPNYAIEFYGQETETFHQRHCQCHRI